MQPATLLRKGTTYAMNEVDGKMKQMEKYKKLMEKTKGDPKLLLEELEKDPELQKELMDAALFPYNKMAEEGLKNKKEME